MKLVIAAIGRLKASPERDLFDRYTARARDLAPHVGIHSLDCRERDVSKASSAEARRAAEAQALQEIAGKGAWLCALDERGHNMTSAAFAQQIARLRDQGVPVFALLIGGPDGLDPALRQACSQVIAFGAQTWPHLWVRVMLAEQLYRSFTILSGHPYHRV